MPQCDGRWPSDHSEYSKDSVHSRVPNVKASKKVSTEHFDGASIFASKLVGAFWITLSSWLSLATQDGCLPADYHILSLRKALNGGPNIINQVYDLRFFWFQRINQWKIGYSGSQLRFSLSDRNIFFFLGVG